MQGCRGSWAGTRCHPAFGVFRDTCNVYVLASGRDAIIDFGSGAVLDHLGDFGVERVTDVLVTHHHRDQIEGLTRAREAAISIKCPTERELVDDIDRHWQYRPISNYYDLRQDRFSLLESVPVTGTVNECPDQVLRRGRAVLPALPRGTRPALSVTWASSADIAWPLPVTSSTGRASSHPDWLQRSGATPGSRASSRRWRHATRSTPTSPTSCYPPMEGR